LPGNWQLATGNNTQGKTMKRNACRVNITDDEMKIIDRTAEKLGYASRTELVTALLRSLIYAKPFRKY